MTKAPLPSSILTLDGWFAKAVADNGLAKALVDPINRQMFTSGAPKTYTYTQLDAAISRVAERLLSFGLKPLDVVMVQLPNTVEMVISLLAISRAGLIAAPVPVSWGLHEVRKAANTTRPKAILTCDFVGKQQTADRMRFAAFDCPSIRFVLGFGANLPDGVLSISDALDGDDHPDVRSSMTVKPEHLALITFEESREGIQAFGRTHGQLYYAAFHASQQMEMKKTSVLLCPYLLSTLTGLAAGLLPWLMAGSRLVLNHPFDTAAFGATVEDSAPSHILLPATIAANKQIAPLLNWPSVLCIGVVWPQRALDLYPKADCKIINMMSLGELGFLAAKAEAPGRPRLPLGQTNTTLDQQKITLMDLRLKGESQTKSQLAASTTALEAKLQIRGEMVPIILGSKTSEMEYLETGLLARPVGAMPPAAEVIGQTSLVAVGGLRFDALELEAVLNQHEDIAKARIFNADDALTGTQIAAAIVSSKGQYITPEHLLDIVAAHDMAEYKASTQVHNIGAADLDVEEDLTADESASIAS